MRILFVTPNPTDPLSFYRGALPLARMRRDHDITFTNSDAIGWNHIVDHDMVFFQRPFNPQHIEVMKLAVKWKVPVVADFDDWLFELMEDNPAYWVYERSRELVGHVDKMASHVTVATQDMADMYAERGVATTVVPNAYDTDMFTPCDATDRRKIVLWRGSNSHQLDLISVRQGWIELIRKHKDWQFIFMNLPPWWMGESFENVKTIEGQGMIEYMRSLETIKPAIMTHPLVDSRFNRAKSMCSWIEASHAGAAFVGPAFREYQRPGITNYEPGNSDSFFAAIDGLIEQPELIPYNAMKGQSVITTELSLREVNKIRMEVFKRYRK